MSGHAGNGDEGERKDDDALLQLLRRLSLEADFDPSTLRQLCIDLRDAALLRSDEKAKVSARLASRIAELIERNFIKDGNGARPQRNGGKKSSCCGC